MVAPLVAVTVWVEETRLPPVTEVTPTVLKDRQVVVEGPAAHRSRCCWP
jgi:hypothetical protein